jgi:hypothetical protein
MIVLEGKHAISAPELGFVEKNPSRHAVTAVSVPHPRSVSGNMIVIRQDLVL